MLTLKRVYEPAAPGGRLARPRRAALAVEAGQGERCHRSLGEASRAQRRAASVVWRAAYTNWKATFGASPMIGSAAGFRSF